MEVKTYLVDWLKLFRAISNFLAFSIVGIVVVILVIRFLQTGFNISETFKHLNVNTLFTFLMLLVPIWAFLGFSCFIFSKGATVKVIGNCISGRNYWYFKRTMSIFDIQRLYMSSENGLEFVVLDGGKRGEIYISTKTCELEELLELIKQKNPGLWDANA